MKLKRVCIGHSVSHPTFLFKLCKVPDANIAAAAAAAAAAVQLAHLKFVLAVTWRLIDHVTLSCTLVSFTFCCPFCFCCGLFWSLSRA